MSDIFENGALFGEPQEELRIGIIGYSNDADFDEVEADIEIEEMLDEVLSEFDDGTKSIVIVANGIDEGVAQVAYDIAYDRGYKTVGITPASLGDKERFETDDELVVGDEPGEDDDFFVDYVDVIIRIGDSEHGDTVSKMAMAEAADIPTIELDI